MNNLAQKPTAKQKSFSSFVLTFSTFLFYAIMPREWNSVQWGISTITCNLHNRNTLREFKFCAITSKIFNQACVDLRDILIEDISIFPSCGQIKSLCKLY